MAKWTFCALVISGLLWLPKPAFALRVIIDPGHGGHDNGAVRNSVRECDIALIVATDLYQLLKKNPEFQPSMTRDQDETLTLKERTDLAREQHEQVFVSIHVNSSLDTYAKGAEIYFQNQLPPDQEILFLASKENQDRSMSEADDWPLPPPKEALHLSSDVTHIIKDLQRNYRLRASARLAKAVVKNWRGWRRTLPNVIKQAPFYVISHVPMPSILVELGYLSHHKEAQLLVQPWYQHQLATGIYQGLVQFKESMDKSQAPPLKWADAHRWTKL